MAFRIKNVQFHSSKVAVLLQNENGPCPLLAAANVLLLKERIELPQQCIRSGVVSAEELLQLLADRALKRSDQIMSQKDQKERKKQSQHQVDELMEILPKLQYGMDVNPRFTQGPEGYEFTIGLSAFDLLGVDLVHGWLLSPEDGASSLIGQKTYNEVIEIVVKGNDAKIELEKTQKEITQKQALLETNAVDWVAVEDEKEIENKDENENEDGYQTVVPDQQNQTSMQPELDESKSSEDLSKEIEILEESVRKLQEDISVAELLNLFLSDTGHQLTKFGLEKLHQHLSEDDLCVFFRNNHFSTITKHDGKLFLLVTDLGYSDIIDVVWERLDTIDGNTDLYDSFFLKPEPKDDYVMSHEQSPESILAHRDQTNADYQLALHLANQSQSVEAPPSHTAGGNNNITSDNFTAPVVSNTTPSNMYGNDEELARKLQSELDSGFDASERLARQLHNQEILAVQQREALELNRNRNGRTQQDNRRSRQESSNRSSSNSNCLIS